MTDDQFLKQLGSKIRKARIAQGISLQKLSRMCDRDYAALWKIEMGRSNARVLTIVLVAKALDLDLRELIK